MKDDGSRNRRRRLLCNTRSAAKHRGRLSHRSSRQMFGAQDAIIQNARCASDLVFRDFDDDDVGVISEKLLFSACCAGFCC